MAIEYRKGICSSCGEDKMIVKRTYMLCYKCNESRLDKTRGPKKKTPIKSKSKPSGELTLFKSIWSTRTQVSFLSGRDLSSVPDYLWLNMFAHVLSKSQSKYPKFKLYSKNIILLHPDEHFLLDHGNSDQRDKYAKKWNCDWSSIDKLREQLKREYDRL
jgi:hypothetical protein